MERRRRHVNKGSETMSAETVECKSRIDAQIKRSARGCYDRCHFVVLRKFNIAKNK